MAELKIDKEWVRNAVQPTIDRIKAEYIHKSVIEDIKAEIEQRIEMFVSAEDFDKAVTVRSILNIIDKHTSEDMRGDTE